MVEIDGRLRIGLPTEDRTIYLSDSDEAYCAISIDEEGPDGLKLTVTLTLHEAGELMQALWKSTDGFLGRRRVR